MQSENTQCRESVLVQERTVLKKIQGHSLRDLEAQGLESGRSLLEYSKSMEFGVGLQHHPCVGPLVWFGFRSQELLGIRRYLMASRRVCYGYFIIMT